GTALDTPRAPLAAIPGVTRWGDSQPRALHVLSSRDGWGVAAMSMDEAKCAMLIDASPSRDDQPAAPTEKLATCARPTSERSISLPSRRVPRAGTWAVAPLTEGPAPATASTSSLRPPRATRVESHSSVPPPSDALAELTSPGSP